jgi:hypothetical protein
MKLVFTQFFFKIVAYVVHTGSCVYRWYRSRYVGSSSI